MQDTTQHDVETNTFDPNGDHRAGRGAAHSQYADEGKKPQLLFINI